ncbi:MAG: sulfite exporter TauE/SafE family protein [Candidatus Dormibacteraceae bacterium]
MTELLSLIGLAALGVLVGAYGTLIGAGGGFVLVPVLLLLYPHDSPAKLTAISLAVVFANSSSGSLSYFRLRRADYRSGFWLAIATLPGAVLGALAVSAIPRSAFEVIIGLILLTVGGYLAIRPQVRMPLLLAAPFVVQRAITDASGRTYSYRFNLALATLVSVGVGFLSSLLGIGGGIIHVPVLTTFFGFPEHVATATSHFVLMFMSGAATGTHALEGDYATTLATTAALAVGALVGAPLGARISNRIEGRWIVRLLAVALGVVGLRLLVAALMA